MFLDGPSYRTSKDRRDGGTVSGNESERCDEISHETILLGRRDRQTDNKCI
jgi:hypothetical protein